MPKLNLSYKTMFSDEGKKAPVTVTVNSVLNYGFDNPGFQRDDVNPSNPLSASTVSVPSLVPGNTGQGRRHETPHEEPNATINPVEKESGRATKHAAKETDPQTLITNKPTVKAAVEQSSDALTKQAIALSGLQNVGDLAERARKERDGKAHVLDTMFMHKKGAQRWVTLNYVKNNRRKITFLIIFLLLNVVAFTMNAWAHRHDCPPEIIARGCGMCLSLDISLLLFCVLRRSISALYGTFVGRLFPLDQNITFHRVIGWTIVLLTVVHTIGHCGGVVWYHKVYGKYEIWEYLFLLEPNLGGFFGLAPITGIVLDLLLIVIALCAVDRVRRNGYFQLFYRTHLLYLPFLILCVLHAPNFWKFALVPGVLLFVEKMSRLRPLMRKETGKIQLIRVVLLPSQVTQLVFRRPPQFSYKAGDYVQLLMPFIAKQEWHPFTITSSPENKDEIWLHVRVLGSWTDRLRKHFEEHNNEKGHLMCKLLSVTKISDESCNSLDTVLDIPAVPAEKVSRDLSLTCHMDGPYGTSSREVFTGDHIVLIGAGIGVTPYISILQTIWARYHKHLNTGAEKSKIAKLKQVDFLWVNKNYDSFEWFVDILQGIEDEQNRLGLPRKLINMQVFLTRCAESKNIPCESLGMSMSMDLLNSERSAHKLSSLRDRTRMGRPNWPTEFRRVDEAGSKKVNVFFCGPTSLARNLKDMCGSYGFGFRREYF